MNLRSSQRCTTVAATACASPNPCAVQEKWALIPINQEGRSTIAIQVDSIAALRAFVAAADGKSFKLAGQSLGISSSAVGKAIARLEGQLDARLFHRTTRTIALTEEGTIYLERVRHILGELATAEDEIASTTTAPRGRLRVSLPLTGGALTPVMAAFIERYPEVELDIDFTDRLVDVIAEGFDSVVRTGTLSDSRLLQRKLGDFVWQLVAAPAYVERKGRPACVTELAGHVCLRQKLTSGQLSPWSFKSEPHVVIPAALTASVIDPVLILALAGAGIAACPDFMVRPHIAAGALVPLLEGELDHASSLYVLWPASRFKTPKVRSFVEFLSEWSHRELS